MTFQSNGGKAVRGVFIGIYLGYAGSKVSECKEYAYP
jgi:hypothetical protein